MKRIIMCILVLLNIILIIPTKNKEKRLILNDFIIIIDPGHE